ncbi:ABC transporter ATP-binding protein [Microbacterium rhizophilus]|uniref:ABC transporter ATP-binding protein n=1 Tax=Microbacterium rhizophilus TaxID=3138934 RepID=UPI0031F00853
MVHDGAIGYVPQNHDVDHPFSVHEMVVMGRARRLRPWQAPTRDDVDAAWQALDRVGLADIGDRPFAALSGGQRQLTLMARALVSSPTIVILDEPTSALDLRNQRRVLTTLHNLAADGVGVIFTTHDPTHALHVSQRTVLMDEDVHVGRTGDLLTADTLSRVYRTPVHTTEFAFGDASTRTVVIPDLLIRRP